MPDTPAAADSRKTTAAAATRNVRLNPALAGIAAHEDNGWVITHDPKGTAVPAEVADRLLTHEIDWNGRMTPVGVLVEQ